MTVDELIERLGELKNQGLGGCEVLMADDNDSQMGITTVYLRVSNGEFPDDWQMPKGFKFVQLHF